MLRRLPLVVFAIALGACSTFDDRELASFRQKRVPPPVYSKLTHGDPLGPSDVIELTRRGVADALIIRQLDDHGVTSLIERDDVRRMRRAGVSAAVIDAMLWESDDFARRYAGPRYVGAYDPGYGYYDPWPWWGAFGIGFSTGGYYGAGCWR